ncbi:Bikaverin cluster transcription factor bik5 [Penicillium rolfsii]|nr:Bikaverin cluster transcription factor bik5 [Penicillium rolfsii]
MEYVRRYNVERSCLRCHERKVRCDRGIPCNKCVRLNVPCQYPGPRRAKRRPPKTTVTDVVARLEQLERSITTLAGNRMAGGSTEANQASVGTNAQAQVAPVSLPSDSEQSSSGRPARDEESHCGFLSRDGRYIDEPLLSRVLEKEKDLQSVMGSPDSMTPASRKPPPLKVDGILTNPHSLQADLKALYPTRWQATWLWQIFLSRVDPVLKVIHVPTTTPRIFMAINRPDAVRPDVQCLLFAIFFAATTALLSDDPTNEETRKDLCRYQQGLEIAMHHSSFLDSPTVTSLQAMAIYLTCLRYTNSGRSGFTLRGLAIRAAQSIGLHRDGKNFKLPPLECELRRRLWWTLFTTDARMAEDHGITVSEPHFGADTELPANIDDQNITETQTTPAQPLPRWTDMTFALLVLEINSTWMPIFRASSNAETLIADLKTRLHERYLQHADMDIPIHRQGVMVAQILVSKLEVHVRQKSLQRCSSAATDVNADDASSLLGMACDALELGLEIFSDNLLRGTRWLTSTFTQFHLLTYILWHLCVYPSGPHVARAWRGVNCHFDLTENDLAWPDPGPKWPVLVALRAKAHKIRQAHVPPRIEGFPESTVSVVDPGNGETATGAGTGIRAENLVTGPEGESVQSAEALFDMNGWNLNWAEFSDWNYLAQNLALMGPEDGNYLVGWS